MPPVAAAAASLVSVRRVRVPYVIMELKHVSGRPQKVWLTSLPPQLNGIITPAEFAASIDRIQPLGTKNVLGSFYYPIIFALTPILFLLLLFLFTGSQVCIYLSLLTGLMIGFLYPMILHCVDEIVDHQIRTKVAAETEYYTKNRARVILDPSVRQLTWFFIKEKAVNATMLESFELEIEIQQEGQPRLIQRSSTTNNNSCVVQ